MAGRLEAWAQWAQVVSAIVGAVAAGAAAVIGWQSFQQVEKQQEEAKVVQTLTFFATFNSPAMLSIRGKLSSGDEDWCLRYGYGDPQIQRNYHPSITPAEVASFIDFFDSVHLCSTQGACSDSFAQQLFGAYAREHFDELAQTIVELRRDRGQDYGIGVQTFAGTETPQQVSQQYAQACGAPAEPPAPDANAQPPG